MIGKPKKKYLVPVRSHVSADMIVFANSKTEAWEIAEKDMRESLEKQIENAPQNPMIKDLSGWSEALKSQVELL